MRKKQGVRRWSALLLGVASTMAVALCSVVAPGQALRAVHPAIITAELVYSCRDRSTVEEKATCLCSGATFVPYANDPPPREKQLEWCIQTFIKSAEKDPVCWASRGTELAAGCLCQKDVDDGHCPEDQTKESCLKGCLASQAARAKQAMDALRAVQAAEQARRAAAAAKAAESFKAVEPESCLERECGFYGPYACQVCCPAYTKHPVTYCDSFLGWGKAHCECADGPAQKPPKLESCTQPGTQVSCMAAGVGDHWDAGCSVTCIAGHHPKCVPPSCVDKTFTTSACGCP
jgi:hypothetical protein